MAISPQIGRLGEVYGGLHTSGKIPQDILKGGMDEMGKLIYMTKEMSKFSHFIHTRFGKDKRTVNTREHKVMQLSEFERFYTVQVASTTAVGGRCTIGLRNYEAEQIKINDTLIAANTFVSPVVEGQVLAAVTLNSAANHVVYNPDSAGGRLTDLLFSRSGGQDNATSVYFADYEQLDVISVDSRDSAGPGLTLITLRRCYMGPTATDRGGALIPTGILDTALAANLAGSAIQVGDTLHRALPSFYEGTDAPTGVFKNIEIDNNFTQELKYAVEITNESDIEGTWIQESPLDINRWLMTKRANRDYEIQMIFGKKAKEMDSSGRVRYRSGGVLEFIAKDKDHYLKYAQSTLSWSNLLKFTKEISRLGGSEERYLFCGYSLDTALRASFAESNLVINDPNLTKEFNVEVNSIMGAGVKINLIPSQIMEEMGFGLKGLCLDLDNPSFTPVTHKGYDMKVDKGPNGKGIQANGQQIYKEQMLGIKGLERRYRDYHSILDFTNIGA